MAIKQLTAEDFEDATVVHSQAAEDFTAQQNDIDDQINSILAEVGTDKNDVTFHFQVWRVVKDQAEMAYLFKGTPADLPIMDRLRDEFDGGKFFIQIYKNKKRFRRLTVSVEAPKKQPIAQLVRNDMAEMVRVLADQQEKQFAMLRDTMIQLTGKPSTPQPSQMEMMTGMMTLMMSMKQFVSAPPQDTFGPEKMMDLLIKGMEIGRESGGGGEGSTLMDIARDLIKSPLLVTLSQAANQPQNQTPAQNRQQLPTPQANATLPNNPLPLKKPESEVITEQSQPKAEGKKMNLTESVMKHYLNMLVQKAEKDSDPILYAEFILDNVPLEMVQENIAREDLIEYAASFDPRVKRHEKWFTELRDHIVNVLTEEDTEEEDGEEPLSTPDGDIANASVPAEHSTDDPGRNGGNT